MLKISVWLSALGPPILQACPPIKEKTNTNCSPKLSKSTFCSHTLTSSGVSACDFALASWN